MSVAPSFEDDDDRINQGALAPTFRSTGMPDEPASIDPAELPDDPPLADEEWAFLWEQELRHRAAMAATVAGVAWAMDRIMGGERAVAL